jgi:hypothetical protein
MRQANNSALTISNKVVEHGAWRRAPGFSKPVIPAVLLHVHLHRHPASTVYHLLHSASTSGLGRLPLWLLKMSDNRVAACARTEVQLPPMVQADAYTGRHRYRLAAAQLPRYCRSLWGHMGVATVLAVWRPGAAALRALPLNMLCRWALAPAAGLHTHSFLPMPTIMFMVLPCIRGRASTDTAPTPSAPSRSFTNRCAVTGTIHLSCRLAKTQHRLTFDASFSIVHKGVHYKLR